MGLVEQISNCILGYVLLRKLDSKTQANCEEPAALMKFLRLTNLLHFWPSVAKNWKMKSTPQHCTQKQHNQ